MRPFIDITNQTFGRLKALKPVYRNNRTYWLCECECGNLKEIRQDAWGKTNSCGCMQIESRTTHHLSGDKLYTVWKNMKTRCYNSQYWNYPNYGGRGITICEEWLKDFSSFYSWALSSGYQEGLTIERVNNDGPYSPDNCKWATKEEQDANRRNNHRLTYKGETKTVTQWAKLTGLPAAAILSRIRYGWSPDEIIETPSGGKSETIVYDGITEKISYWSKVTGFSAHTIRMRLRAGWSVEDTLLRPVRGKESLLFKAH